MENISVNNLVEEFESSLPREISISIAKNILNSKISKENAISEYKKNIGFFGPPDPPEKGRKQLKAKKRHMRLRLRLTSKTKDPSEEHLPGM